MTDIIAYIRVSTRQQEDAGISLDAQQARIAAYCEYRGLSLVDVVTDVVTSKVPLADRPGGSQLLAALACGEATAVVSTKLDRLFRDTVETLVTTREWDREGVALHVLDLGGTTVDTSSPMGRMFITMVAGFAELERAQIQERTREALAHKRSRGEYTGGRVPYGYELGDDGVHLVECEAEQAVVTLARSLREAGLSLRAIAAELATAGHTTRRGTAWAPQQISRLCRTAG